MLAQIVQSGHVVEFVTGCRIPRRCECLGNERRLADADVPKREGGWVARVRPPCGMEPPAGRCAIDAGVSSDVGADGCGISCLSDPWLRRSEGQQVPRSRSAIDEVAPPCSAGWSDRWTFVAGSARRSSPAADGYAACPRGVGALSPGAGGGSSSWLWREAGVCDLEGRCLFHAGAHRFNPPWRLGGWSRLARARFGAC